MKNIPKIFKILLPIITLFGTVMSGFGSYKNGKDVSTELNADLPAVDRLESQLNKVRNKHATPLVGLLGKPEAKLIVPGNAALSELLGRMNRRGAGQMPLLGSHQIDEVGVTLIREWINSLPGNE